MASSTSQTPVLVWKDGRLAPGSRTVPVETAIAFTYGGSTHAVMMATPADLDDLAIGFSLTEGIIGSIQDVTGIEVIDTGQGLELRIDIVPARQERQAARRRALAGPIGCGLCGIESLDQAMRPPATVSGGGPFRAANILAAMTDLSARQPMNEATHAVHAAAFWSPARGIESVREDVGRHNALDKLSGALARSGRMAAEGAVLLTSRVSVEMIQKTASIGIPLLVAISAPTSLAIEAATAAGLTLVAVARSDGFEVFTAPERITFD